MKNKQNTLFVLLGFLIIAIFSFILYSYVYEELNKPFVFENIGSIENKPKTEFLISEFFANKNYDTDYITPVNWEPKVFISSDFEYPCNEDQEFCKYQSAEGAAGSQYIDFLYSKKIENQKILNISFSFRFVQCLNYPEEKIESCKKEQELFGADEIAREVFGLLENKI